MKRPNGTGSVIKDKNGTYRAVITVGFKPDGKAIRKSKRGFKTKKEAMFYLDQLRNEKPKAKISTLWETYLLTDFLDLSYEKQRHYQSVYDKLYLIHNTSIDSLTILDLQRLIEPLGTRYAQKDVKTVLSHLYKIAIAEQIVQVNLTQYMRLKDHTEKKGEAWSNEDLKIFWSNYDKGDRMCGYILFMSYTGTMPGELRVINRSMIDYEKCEINGAGLKTDLRRSSPIYLCDKIIPILKDLMTDSVVLWPRSKQDFYDEYHLCLARCGIDYKPPYTCRHTAATLLIQEASPFEVQKFMRHAQISTTQRYVHPTSESMLKAVNKL